MQTKTQLKRKTEDTSERIRRVCVRSKYVHHPSPSPIALAAGVAILVIGIAVIGLAAGWVCTGLFQHYAAMLTRLSHG